MHPRLLTIPAFELLGRSIGPFTLHTYGVLLAVAFLAGLWVASRQAKRAGLDANRITDMAVWVLIAGLLGAKLLLVAPRLALLRPQPARDPLHPPERGRLLRRPHRRASSWPRGTCGATTCRAGPTADVLAPGVVLGQAIGRLGCFSAGCCWGRATQVPWAVIFTDVYAARAVGTPMDTPLHPSQLYESLAAFLIFLFLLWLAPRKRFHGQVTLAYVALYSAVRFALEFLRGDPDRGAWLGGSGLDLPDHRGRPDARRRGPPAPAPQNPGGRDAGDHPRVADEGSPPWRAPDRRSGTSSSPGRRRRSCDSTCGSPGACPRSPGRASRP